MVNPGNDFRLGRKNGPECSVRKLIQEYKWNEELRGPSVPVTYTARRRCSGSGSGGGIVGQRQVMGGSQVQSYVGDVPGSLVVVTAQRWPRTAATNQPTATMSTTSSTQLRSVPPGPVPADPCGVAGTGPGGGSEAVPAGMALFGSNAGNQAARFALAQLGRPYEWGSNGPNSWDCSSLMQAGWASAGVAIPRTTFVQVNAGTPVALAEARSGDLVFTAGTGGTAQDPVHVGMVAGRVGAAIYLVAAPRAGEVVQVTPASQWASQIVAVRRIG